ncbi:MAG: hypothetical protein NT059_04255 [Planctomycetota bacterium]|nr:hypothetical protein [Planctomycetota bacterium]
MKLLLALVQLCTLLCSLCVCLPATADSSWPQTVSDGDRSFVIYGPQFNSYGGDMVGLTHAVTRVRNGAASISPADIGSMTVSAQATTAADDGELEIASFQVDSLSFGGVVAPQDDIDAVQRAIATRAFCITRRALVHDMQIENVRAAGTPGLGDFVPRFRIERQRATLITIDGDPQLKDLADTNWRQVINTPFLVLQAQDGSFVVRLGDDRWMGSAELGKGYAPVDAPPAAVIVAIGTAPLPPSGVTAPSSGPAGASAGSTAVSAVLVVTDPTVLISMNGEPVLADIAPGVQWVANARTMVLRTATPIAWWTLASGRWFSAPTLDGTWTRVAATAVPEEFRALPSGRTFDHVKASIPRTPESVAAVAAAQEARTVQVMRAAAHCSVNWSGAPLWQGIDGTLLRGSVNASQPVIECDRYFYCCDNAVWFSAAVPEGPWTLCDDLPDAISQIQASSPLYAATAVDIVGSTADSVTFSYVPAYLGTFVDNGTVVYGNGYDEPGIALPGNGWMPQPQTFDLPLTFDMNTGTFAPPTEDADQGTQPALDPDVLVNGWIGWGWCPGWTSACGWGWRNPAWWSDWRAWWRHWNPYWNHWANARTAAQLARDNAAIAERNSREQSEVARQQGAADQRRIDAQEADWRARQAAVRSNAEEARRAERAEEARLRDTRDAVRRAQDERARAAAVRSGPTAPPGSMAWWYEYANDYSSGYLSRATGYQDPRYGVAVGRGGNL